jgi:uncharacterized protein Usg
MTSKANCGKGEVSQDFLKQLAGYGLATAEILYRMPDHPRFLQTYIWQDYDIAPEFPTRALTARSTAFASAIRS